MKRFVRWSMRAGVLALLGLAILNPTLPVEGSRRRVYVIDASASVATARGAETFTTDDALRLATHDLRSLDPDDHVALIAFGAKPAVLVPLSAVSKVRFPPRIEGVDGSSTDLAAALETAAALAEGGEIVLFSDARSTAGRVPVERIRVPVNPFPLGPVGGVDASIRSIDAPAAVPSGASFQIRIAVESTGPWSGELAAGDERRPLEFTGPGRQDVVFTRTLAGEELVLALRLSGSDVCPENDAAELNVWREAQSPRVVFDLQSASEADVVVIERLRADAVPPSDLARLAALVRDGGAGLVMLGGSSAFALGGWGGTPVEDLLPFWAFPDERSAVVILLDRSGSMGKPAPGRTRPRIVEAGAAVRRALALAHPEDELALVTFAGSAEVRCPLVAGREKGRVAAALEGISAGGTTVLGKALDLAGSIVKGSKAGRRRLLLVADGESIGEEGDLRSAALLLKAEGIGVTIVRTGESSTPALAILREAGAEEIDGSDFALVDETVSAAFARTRDLTGPPPGRVTFQGALSGLRGALPERINRVSLKPGSVVLAKSGEVPVVAVRPAGRGRAAACAFSIGDWPDRAELMSRLVESVAPPSPGLAADVSLRFEDDRLEIAAALKGPGRPDRFEVTVDGAPVALVRRGENTYAQTLRHNSGTAAVRIGGRVAAAARRPHPREFERVGPDGPSLRALARATGGAFLDAPRDLASLPGRGPSSTRSARPLLLGAALALFLLDVALALLWRA